MKKMFFSMAFTLCLTVVSAFTAMAAAPSGGTWINDSSGWTFVNRDGTTPNNTWEIINGKLYYFDETGHILMNTTTPDGSTVDGSGAKTKDGKPIVYDGGEKELFPYYPTTIKAAAPTLADTGLSVQIGAYEKDMVKALGPIQPCIGVHGEPKLYTFENCPSVVFHIDSATNKDSYCINARGPFAAFFTCSGTDTITCAQLEEVLGVKITIGAALFEDRHYATFTYNGHDYSIFSCTHEGVFQGDSVISVLTHFDWERQEGFFDESGAWISL